MSKSTIWILWNPCHSQDSLTIITITNHLPLHITINKKNWGEVWILHKGTMGLTFCNLDTLLLIVYKIWLQIYLSVLATEKNMKVHPESSVHWDQAIMGPSIAIIMGSKVVCTHLTVVERFNSNHMVVASHRQATPVKTTMICRVSRVHLPALP